MKTFLEFINEAILPIEYRHRNLIYHSTEFVNLVSILKDNVLYGTTDYDFGVATSRNKDYLFGRIEDGEVGARLGECQLILDRDKIKRNYKIQPFDWENWKQSSMNLNNAINYQQSEEKILTEEIKNIHKYIVGIYLNKYIKKNYEYLKNDTYISSLIDKYNWVIFDDDWVIIGNDYNWFPSHNKPEIFDDDSYTITCHKCKALEDTFAKNENPEEYGWSFIKNKWYCSACLKE